MRKMRQKEIRTVKETRMRVKEMRMTRRMKKLKIMDLHSCLHWVLLLNHMLLNHQQIASLKPTANSSLKSSHAQ
jgi:hypothetical protein